MHLRCFFCVIQLFFFSFLISGCQNPPEIDVLSNHTVSNGKHYSDHLIVVVNQPNIESLDIYSKKIITSYINNDFSSIDFDFNSKGYPYRLSAIIYRSLDDFRDGNPFYEFRYEPTTNPLENTAINIKDDSEKYNLIIEKEKAEQ